MKLQKSIIALLALFVFAMTANAQFDGLINKAKKEIDKTTKKVNTGTKVNTNGGNGSSVPGAGSESNEDACWDLFKCKPEYVGAANENKLREIVQYNVNNFYGNGGLIVLQRQHLC